MAAHTVYAIGECMIELASLGGDRMRKGFAGDTFNTAWYAHAFLPPAWKTAYFTALGDDRASGEMMEFMANSGIDTGYIRRIPDRSPGLYVIHLDNGERSFSYWRSASAAKSLADDGDALEKAMNDADIVYFSGITLAILPEQGRRTLLDLASAQRRRGKVVAFDPNIRPRLWTDKTEMLATISAGARASSIVMPGFDDEAAGRHAVDAIDAVYPGERLIARLGVDLFFLDQPAELFGDARLARLGALHRDVAEQHMIARLRRHLRDSRAHLPRADHAYRLHACLP